MEDTFTSAFYRQLQQLKIHTRRAFLGSRQGIHRSSRRGHGLEFSDFRLYTPGDDFRHIDWRAYGRSERLYIRQFQEEQDLNICILIDSSQSMNFGEPKTKFEVAKELALSLGYVGLTDGDAVNFAVLGQFNTPKYQGPKAIARARKELVTVSTSTTFDMSDAIRKAVQKHKIPGKCFFISDFMLEDESLYSALDILRFKNFDVSVIQLLSPEELTLNIPVDTTYIRDAESSEIIDIGVSSASKAEYANLLAQHIEKLEKYCLKCGMSHALVSSDESISDIVLTRFPALGILK